MLTSIWFRCAGATSLTDAGGGIASLLFGALALMIPLTSIRSSGVRLTVLMFGSISLLWIAAQLISHAAFNRDDWHFIALRMRWPWEWRPAAIVAGVTIYVVATRRAFMLLRNPAAPGPRALRLAYFASAGSAALAGLMWQPEPVRSAIEGVLTLGVAPLGLLVAAHLARSRQEQAHTAPITRSWSLLATSFALFAVFCVVQGRGLGPLAHMALPT